MKKRSCIIQSVLFVLYLYPWFTTYICLFEKLEQDSCQSSDFRSFKSLHYLVCIFQCKDYITLFLHSVILSPITWRNLHSHSFSSILQFLFTFSLVFPAPLPRLLLFSRFTISDPSLSFLLPPCDCSHFLTIPRTRHIQPIDGHQKDHR